MTTAAVGLVLAMLLDPQLQTFVLTTHLGELQGSSLDATRTVQLDLQSSTYRDGKPAADIAGAIKSKLFAAGFKVVEHEGDQQAVLRVKYQELQGQKFEDGLTCRVSSDQ